MVRTAWRALVLRLALSTRCASALATRRHR